MIALLDLNVLLALGWNSHPHNQSAKNWFSQNAKSGWATCLPTESGFLRHMQNPTIVKPKHNCQRALKTLANLVSHPNHTFIEPLPTLRNPPFDELAPLITGHKQVPDATLLHLARFHNLKLITFDQSITAICPWPANLEIIIP